MIRVKLVFLGPPGAGKGTQAKILVSKGYTHISTGDLLREEVAKGSELGRKVKSIMERGELVPDEIVLDLVVDKVKGKDNFILDGFPRTIPQAEALERLVDIDMAVYFFIDEETAVDRISFRRSCPKCGRIYHLKYDPPKNDELCDECRVPLVQRDDDREEVVRKRYKVYLEKTSPLLDYYEKKGLLRKLDARKPKDEVTRELMSLLGL